MLARLALGRQAGVVWGKSAPVATVPRSLRRASRVSRRLPLCIPRARVPQQRQVGEAVLLEASLENATKAPMLVDSVTFMPTPPWAAERIGGGGAAALQPPVPAAPGAALAATVGETAGEGSGPLRWLRVAPRWL